MNKPNAEKIFCASLVIVRSTAVLPKPKQVAKVIMAPCHKIYLLIIVDGLMGKLIGVRGCQILALLQSCHNLVVVR